MTDRKEVQGKAAAELASAAVGAFVSKEGNMHPGTTVAGVARMAGTYMFRSFDHDLANAAPGMVVLSPAANAASDKLTQLVGIYLATTGVKLDNSQAGKPPEAKHKPVLDFLVTQRALEKRFQPIKDRHGLTNVEAGQVAAMAAGILIKHCAAVMDPSAGFGIAVFGFVEGTKTAPDPVTLPAAT